MPQEITTYIPQRSPIVMVSEIHEATEENAHTSFFIEPDNIFCENGFLSESGLIENMAQSAAAMTGYLALQKKEPVKKGFIGSIKNLTIYELPKADTTIDTFVSIDTIVLNVSIVIIKITQNKLPVAECEMKIFLEE